MDDFEQMKLTIKYLTNSWLAQYQLDTWPVNPATKFNFMKKYDNKIHAMKDIAYKLLFTRCTDKLLYDGSDSL